MTRPREVSYCAPDTGVSPIPVAEKALPPLDEEYEMWSNNNPDEVHTEQALEQQLQSRERQLAAALAQVEELREDVAAHKAEDVIANKMIAELEVEVGRLKQQEKR